MKIEILFPAFANLYGEKVAVQYLAQCLPDAQFVETELTDTPAFAEENVDMIFIGSMTELQQELAIEKLLPFKARIEELIEGGTVFLAVGNSLELFCNCIEEGERVIPALGIFDYTAKRDMDKRYNSLILGEMNGFKIVGFKNQFSHLYGNNENEYLYKVIRGDGIHPGSMLEGIHRKNFMGTYTLGPLLILNPDLIKYIFALMGCPDTPLKFEESIRKAYEIRLKEFEDPNRIYD